MDDATLSNDAPITEPGQDRLGFGELARHLANVFLRNDLSGGLVVGIEGEWGSGKSSLANFALKELENKKDECGLRVVRFSPWIIGNRDQLLGQLFIDLDSALFELLPTDRYKQIRTALRKFSQGAALLSIPLKFAADMGVSAAGAVGGIVDSAASVVSELGSPSLSKLNEELRNNLADFKGRIVVFIDDLDRLEPQETVEVLRLVRAVADFPKVAYLLAYDPSILAKSLETALGLENGKTYIEKIVQASFTIPEPMGFDLRSWLAEETMATLGRADLTPEANERLERALSCWCSEYISTPRDVVRAANALKLHIAPLVDRLDPADGLFIQIIRINRPELHNWVERYLVKKFGSDPNDFHLAWKDAVEDSDGERELELARIIGKQGDTQLRFLDDLRQHLPQASIPDSHSPLAFGAEERQQFAVGRRLYSPSYFRQYFALSTPAGFLGDEEVLAFLDMCLRDRKTAVRHFRDRCAEERPQGGNMAQVLLSRILERKGDIAPDLIPGLFAVLGDGMDAFGRRLPELPGNPPWLYGAALEIFRLIGHLDDEGKRMGTLGELFANAASLAWLNSIVRETIIEHGFAGHQARPVEQRLLTEEEFEFIRVQFLERLEQATAADLKETPYFLSLMYGWHWADGGKEGRAWVRKQSSEDSDFVDLIGRMMSKKTISYGNGTRDDYYLARQTLEMFFGSVEGVMRALNKILSKPAQPDELRERASRFLASIQHETQA